MVGAFLYRDGVLGVFVIGVVYLLHEVEHLVSGMVYLVTPYYGIFRICIFFSSGKPLLKAIPFASLWEKVRRLKKSTPPPVVAVVTNISYGCVVHRDKGVFNYRCRHHVRGTGATKI